MSVSVVGSPDRSVTTTGSATTGLGPVVLARAGRTFRYTASGPEGLLKGKKVSIVYIAAAALPSKPDHTRRSQWGRVVQKRWFGVSQRPLGQ